MIASILFAIMGTSAINLGFLLQKSVAYLITFNLESPLESIKSVLKQKRWLLGFLLTVAGWFLFLIAYNGAPVSIIAPLNNVGILVLVGVATFWLKEKLTLFEWLGISTIFLGILIISLNSMFLEIQIETFEKANLVNLTLLCIFLMVIVLFFPYYSKWNVSGIFYSIASGISGGLAAIFTKILTIVLSNINELIIFALVFLFFQTLSFLTLQASFQHERAMITVPLFNSFSTVIPILGGIFIFLETLNIFQIAGILFILIGSSALFNFSTPNAKIEKERNLIR